MKDDKRTHLNNQNKLNDLVRDLQLSRPKEVCHLDQLKVL